MPTLGAPLDFAKLEGRNFRAHVLGTAPSSPVTGQLYYDTGGNVLYYWNGTAWIAASGGTPADATTSSKGIVQLAGDLAGTAASPQIAAGVITDVEVAAANKDGAAATASMRTLGNTSGKAMNGTWSLDTIASQNPPVAFVPMNSQRITSLADPTGATDAANKQYVDAVAQGLAPKDSVRAATTANITISTALNNADVLDGVTLATGDRVLVKNQSAPAENGIYVVAASPARATDADAWTELPAAFTFVEQGTANADTGWVCTADQGGTLNTTAVTWGSVLGRWLSFGRRRTNTDRLRPRRDRDREPDHGRRRLDRHLDRLRGPGFDHDPGHDHDRHLDGDDDRGRQRRHRADDGQARTRDRPWSRRLLLERHPRRGDDDLDHGRNARAQGLPWPARPVPDRGGRCGCPA